ncbi:pyruvate kinase [Aeromonas sobria]|uniref:Pyruvate kinase n=1 Tax=Aeromonas sobria TaxID=646 RepID=A0A2N3J0B6_AERSO|nr:pyruvate kinase [Aeromonas sobria]PKQ78890.1 pyruvate kinase [Aeromonas sobria]TNJ23771.1 pyruvate kinase [Aeromonas sobria]
MRKTKIIATLGPASSTADMVEKLMVAGANVFRLNFSHGCGEQHIATASLIRTTAARLGLHIGILADLQGPKIRIARFATGSITLTPGASFILDAAPGDQPGDQDRVGLDYPELINDVRSGNILLLDDGRIQLEVLHIEGSRIFTRVQIGGPLSDRKGINVLGGGLSAPALTDKDRGDILTASQIEADFIAVSFPRCAADLAEARTLIRAAGSHAAIVAKVERAEVVASVEAMDEIIRAADIVMVARGDLGVEIGDARLPGVQKKLIKRCHQLGRPVITATQMMESMISSPMPTRAEVLDIANAVIDGTDAVMLSAESAAGLYPVEAVEAMARIAHGAEREIDPIQPRWQKASHHSDQSSHCMALAAMTAAFSHDQSCGIAVLTSQGDAVTAISRSNLNNPIWALSNKPMLLNQMTILRGVTPLFYEEEVEDERDSRQLIAMLEQANQLHGIQSLLINRLDSLEGAGNEDVCRLIPLGSKHRNFTSSRKPSYL